MARIHVMARISMPGAVELGVISAIAAEGVPETEDAAGVSVRAVAASEAAGAGAAAMVRRRN